MGDIADFHKTGHTCVYKTYYMVQREIDELFYEQVSVFSQPEGDKCSKLYIHPYVLN